MLNIQLDATNNVLMVSLESRMLQHIKSALVFAREVAGRVSEQHVDDSALVLAHGVMKGRVTVQVLMK